jgi:ankyrin repeat protein
LLRNNTFLDPNDLPLEVSWSSSWRAIHYCAAKNSLDVAKYLLLRKKVSVDKRDIWNWTPLHIAILFGHSDMAQLLIECGASCKKRTGEDFQYLSKIIEKYTQKMLKTL